jgi:hypothetical protein
MLLTTMSSRSKDSLVDVVENATHVAIDGVELGDCPDSFVSQLTLV